MTVSTTDLQVLMSPVAFPAWSGRWARAASKAASLGAGAPVVLTETTEVGAVIWQAPAPSDRGEVHLTDVALSGLWITSPTRTWWGRLLRRAQLRALFAPERGFGSAGTWPTGTVLCVVVGGTVGAAAGAYGVGGPLALIWGGLLGALLGFAVFAGLVMIGKHRVHGPVNTDDPDVLETVVRLLEIRCDAGDLADLGGDAEIPRTIREILWQITDPCLLDEQYRKLRYQASILGAAVQDARRAQMALDTVTAVDVPYTGSLPTPADHLAQSAADAAGRLQAHTRGLEEVAEQIRTVRRRTP